MDRDRCAQISAFVAVPVLLFFVDWLSRLRSASEFLLVPPLAVIIYLLFSRPADTNDNFRSVVLTPTVGAAAGELSYHFLGLTPWGVALAALAVLAFQALVRSNMPPALALAVLAMLLKVDSVEFALDVGIASAIVWTVFLLWRRFLWERCSQAR